MATDELADLQTRWNSLSKEEETKYGVEIDDNRTTIVWPWEAPHWPEIQKRLSGKIETPEQLEEHLVAISGTNHQIKFFSEYFEGDGKSQKEEFFNQTLPFLQKMALKLPALFQTSPVSILVPQKEQTVVLNKEQVASILASAFFCTFDKYAPAAFTKFKFSDFTFSELLIDSSCQASVECLLNYFKRISQSIPQGNLSVRRVVLSENNRPNWETSSKKLREVTFVLQGAIHESKSPFHVDISNELIGGGVLSGSTVDEESLFLMKPECLVAMLFSAKIESNEAIVIEGAEQFSKCEGSAFNFKFSGNFQDSSSPVKPTIIAIDPVLGSFGEEQFQIKQFSRDLNKLYLGFSSVPSASNIATGLWGCGPMNGDKKLKFLQQVLASGEAGQDLEYRLDSKKDQAALSEFWSQLKQFNPSIGELHKLYFEKFLALKPDDRDLLKNILDGLKK